MKKEIKKIISLANEFESKTCEIPENYFDSKEHKKFVKQYKATEKKQFERALEDSELGWLAEEFNNKFPGNIHQAKQITPDHIDHLFKTLWNAANYRNWNGEEFDTIDGETSKKEKEKLEWLLARVPKEFLPQ